VKWLDLLLNIVLLLLWFNWRAARLNKLPNLSPSSLLLLLTQPRRSPLSGWLSLFAIPLLLVLRAGAYRQIGSAMNWTAQLNLGVVVLPFHSEFGERILLFSILSFGWFWLKFFTWLLALSVVNRGETEPGVILKFIRVQLGPIERLPSFAKLLLPLLLVTIVWISLTPLLLKFGIVPKPSSTLHALAQGAVIGAGAWLPVAYLLSCILLLHILNTYVFLGDYALWQFVTQTARRFLKPFLFLRLGRFDFAPFIGVIVIVLAAGFLERFLESLYQSLPH